MTMQSRLEKYGSWLVEVWNHCRRGHRDIVMNTVYEHPILHSMIIIGPDDSIYVNNFSVEYLDEICDYKAVEFDQPLPEKLHNYLYSFEGIVKNVARLEQQNPHLNISPN
ncbi:hypothetical protein BDC45DRAFT_566473 [Circinella umbellata]|nr:hypothetical protein BDC45DRAFT_566473 [Circinella umbellata]